MLSYRICNTSLTAKNFGEFYTVHLGLCHVCLSWYLVVVGNRKLPFLTLLLYFSKLSVCYEKKLSLL